MSDVARRMSDTEDRFWAKVVTSDGCWEWTGHTANGYGRIRSGGRQIQVHRYSYELANGPISDGMTICHTCDNPICVRPDHLFAADQASNIADMVSKGRHGNQRKTHCKHGHEFTPENTKTGWRGERVCLTCRKNRRSS